MKIVSQAFAEVRNFLVIHDDPRLGSLLTGWSRSRMENASLHQVPGIREGLARLAEVEAEVILLDMGVADCTGTEGVDRIREAARNSAIILVIEPKDEEAALQSLGTRVQDYLIRGEISDSSLSRALRYALSRPGGQAPVPEAHLLQDQADTIKDRILENSNLGIALVQKRVFVWANSRMCAIVGHPLAELLGSPTRILYPSEASFEEAGRRAYPSMQGGQRADVTLELQHSEGSLYWGRLIGVPLDPSLPDEGSVWMLEDVTDRVTAEKERLSLEVQLRHAQKLEAVGQLAAGIAHEINTPIQYVGDNTRFLAEAFQDVLKVLDLQEKIGAVPETVQQEMDEVDLPFLKGEIPKALDQCLEGINRVARIVKAMRDFSHPGSDKLEEVDLNRSIESTITVSRNEWKYVAELVQELDPYLPPVSCFQNEINQVVLNLIVNASHAVEEALRGSAETRGKITVSTAHSGDFAEIRVKDTGTGIPEHVRSRMFDPFFTTKAVGKGTGQGLAIVHTIVVERHKGQVNFETEMGVGTTFILRIPIAGPGAT